MNPGGTHGESLQNPGNEETLGRPGPRTGEGRRQGTSPQGKGNGPTIAELMKAHRSECGRAYDPEVKDPGLRFSINHYGL